jgi:hypothetical protein
MDNYSFPPPDPAPDEIVSPYSSRFGACEQVIGMFSSRVNGAITEQAYSLSEQWGAIIRAKITFERDGSPATALLTCWSGSGSDVRFDLTLDCDGSCDEH